MKIKYFGELEEQMGKSEEVLTIKTLGELVEHLNATKNITAGDYQVAVNCSLVASDINLEFQETDEVAVLSAFAGG